MHFLDLATVSIYARDNEEGEYDLMRFKETSGNVRENHSRDVIDQNIESLLKHIGFLANFNGFIEQTLDVAQRVLIHRVNTCEVSDDEVEDGATDSN